MRPGPAIAHDETPDDDAVCEVTRPAGTPRETGEVPNRFRAALCAALRRPLNGRVSSGTDMAIACAADGAEAGGSGRALRGADGPHEAIRPQPSARRSPRIALA